jgi:hypothetical protein
LVAITGAKIMRVNVYNEELTGRVEPVAKRANGVIFKGLGVRNRFRGLGVRTVFVT